MRAIIVVAMFFVILWHFLTPTPAMQTEPCDTPDVYLQWSPDGSHVLLITADETYLFDTNSPDSPPITAGNAVNRFVSFNPTGELLVTNQALLDTDTLQPLMTFDSTHYRRFTQSGETIIGQDGLWDAASGEQILSGTLLSLSPREWVAYERFPEGDTIHVRVWDLRNPDLMPFIIPTPHENYGIPIRFSPDETLIAVEIAPQTIEIWNIQSGERQTTIIYTLPEAGMEFAPDGRYLITQGRSASGTSIWDYQRDLHVWDVVTGERVAGWEQARVVTMLDDSSILFVNFDSPIRIENVFRWDSMTGTITDLASILPGETVGSAILAQNGEFVLVNVGWTVYLWHVDEIRANQPPSHSIQLSHVPSSMILSADSRRLIAFYEETIVITPIPPAIHASVWDTETGEMVVQIQSDTNFDEQSATNDAIDRSRAASSLRISPDGRWLAYHVAGVYTLLDSETGRELQSFNSPIEFSYDWSRIAYWRDGELHVYFSETGEDVLLWTIEPSACESE